MPRDLADQKARIIAAVKNIDAPTLALVCGKNLNIVSMCAVSPVSKITQISKFTKVHAVGAELFHADGRTDRQT